jgi:hypothetical protein
MEQQLSDSMKAILVKIALELKRLGWKSDSQTNEIDVFQGHLGMYKNTEWRGEQWRGSGPGELPDVQIDISIDMSFAQNEQNGVYFLVFNESYSLSLDGASGSEKQEQSDLNIDFSEADANNIVKIQQAAKELNEHVQGNVDEHGYEYAQESYADWKDYNASGTAYADKSEPWKDDNY